MTYSRFSVRGISRAEAYGLIRASGSDLSALLPRANRIRDWRSGRVIPDHFGSYGQLIASQEFRFRDRHEGCR